MSSLPDVAGVSFDLDSQSGVMQVLAAVRTSDLSASEKNELRDLVFLYSNGGKEPTVRRALEQKISLHKLVPPPPKTTAQPLPPQPTIGKFRSAPVFQAPAPTHSVSETKSPEPVFTTNPVWTRPETKVTPEVSVEPESVPIRQTVPVVEAPVPVSVSEPVAVEVPVVLEPSPVVVPEQPQPVMTTSVGDTDAYLVRIREIKALVNEQVGNPVNLVDINNEVGREYMAALLDAMKKINSGTSAASAMKRLEAAFAAVEEALKVHKGGNVTPVVPQFEPVAAPTAPPAFNPVSHTADPAPSVPEAVPVSVPPQIYPNTTLVTDTPDMPVPPVYTPPAPPAPPPMQPPVFQVPVQTNAPVPPPPPAFNPPQQKAPPVVPLGEPAPLPPKQPDAAPYFASLAEYNAKPSPVADTGRTASLKESAVAGDPLFTPEVDDGLQQLLLEWPIFKKSGIFGTGPKGREHPLFKKLAPLQIPLLLAGRFDGATQEIKQSVTDYMNGWRYEQGIIYQQNETFEHYLRRVIKHILDLQRTK